MKDQLTVYHISTYSPTPCGIATYTEDLITALSGVRSLKVRMQNTWDSFIPDFDITVHKEEEASYLEAIERINADPTAVVSLQHEFGIFGGWWGSHAHLFLDHLRVPIVMTLHTVFPELYEPLHEQLEHLIRKSTAVVVLADETADYLLSQFPVAQGKVHIIRHGVPDIPFAYPSPLRAAKGIGGDPVFLSMGHLRRSKGYHDALNALARVKQQIPGFKYIILGTCQEQNWDKEGVKEDMDALIRSLGLEENVIHEDRYLPVAEVIDYIRMADIGLVTYTDPGQNSSGVLPLMLSCGRPVVATDFRYAADLKKKAGDCLELVRTGDVDSIAAGIAKLTAPGYDLKAAMRLAFERMRPFLWSNAGALYEGLFRETQHAWRKEREPAD